VEAAAGGKEGVVVETEVGVHAQGDDFLLERNGRGAQVGTA